MARYGVIVKAICSDLNALKIRLRTKNATSDSQPALEFDSTENKEDKDDTK